MRLAAAALIAGLAMLLVACGHKAPPWHLHEVSGVLPDLEFTLTDTAGHPARGSDMHGRITVLYLGYAHCPDACPLMLARLAGVRKALGAQADQLHVLFVTVDPARDTPQVLADYCAAFGPGVTGLRGTPDQLRALAHRYRVTWSLGKPDATGAYEVSHSTAAFVFDRQGRARLLATPDATAADLTADIRRLVTQAG